MNSNHTEGNYNVATYIRTAGMAMSSVWRELKIYKLSKALVICSIALVGVVNVGAHAQTADAKVQTSQQQRFTTLMAEAQVAKDYPSLQVGSDDYQAQLTKTTNEVQDARKSGMGWGQIANAAGLQWGKIVSESKQNKPLSSEKRTDKVSQADAKKKTDIGANSDNGAKSSTSGGGKSGNSGGGNGGGNGGGGKK